MKNVKITFIILITLLMASPLIAQKKDAKEVKSRLTSVYPLKTSKQTIISGNYPGSLEKVKVWLLNYSRQIDFLNQDTTFIPITKGRFRFEVSLREPVYFCIEQRGSPIVKLFKDSISEKHFFIPGILIEPGDSLFLDSKNLPLDNKGKLSYQFMQYWEISGRGAEKWRCQQEILKYTKKFDSPFKKNTSVRKGLIDSIANMIVETVEGFQERLSKGAMTIITANYIHMLTLSPQEIISKNNMNLNEKKTKEYFETNRKAYFEKVNPSDADLIYTPYNFEGFIRWFAVIADAINRKVGYDNKKYSKSKYRAMKTYIPSGLYKNRVLANYLMFWLRSSDATEDLHQCIEDYFEITSSNDQNYKDLKTTYQKFNVKSLAGNMAFEFMLPDTLGNIHKLTDFRGKVILIDFMFTGCIGCASMVPELKKVEERYKNNDQIKFISISIDNKEQWKRTSLEYSVPGSLYLHTNNLGSNHPLIKYYGIQGFPRLMLIDKEGKIINVNVPRPDLDNGKALTTLITEALN